MGWVLVQAIGMVTSIFVAGVLVGALLGRYARDRERSEG